MDRSTRIIVLSIAVAGVAGAVMLNNVQSNSAEPVQQAHNGFDDTAAIDDRISALERAVSEERRARQLLEEELLAVYAKIDALQVLATPPDTTMADGAALVAENTAIDARTVRETRGRRSADRRSAMIEAGMSPDRADYILRREEEARFEVMQAAFEARNAGESIDRFSPNMNPDAILRQEIGDADYELYLEANGRSTSVGVSTVMASSPAERAGLQSGDEIVGYDGDRVFSSFELMQLTMAGGEGNVVVDVVRDGSPMQIVVPRGPIGVEIGRFRGR